MSARRAGTAPARAAPRRFPPRLVDALDTAPIVGIRAGDQHRYTGVWPVVVEGRLFVRSWNDKPTGWYQAFREQPRGRLQFGARAVAVRAVPTRSERLRRAVSQAYARKYTTNASQKWVRGFARASRTRTTLELVPA